jgi:hypothetical protein
MQFSRVLSRFDVKGVTSVGGDPDFADFLLKLDADGELPAATIPDAADIPFTPAGSIAATNVQAAIVEHDADTALHLTSSQNTLLDNLTATHTELNYMVGVTSGVQGQIDLKAPLASPALTGVPTAPTASPGTNTTQLATTAFVSVAVANLIGTAPGALDTLGELSDALADDANFAGTITTSLAGKQPLNTHLTAFSTLGTTKGDLAVYNGTGWIRVGVGADDTVLTADSGTGSGLTWAAVSDGTQLIDGVGELYFASGLWETPNGFRVVDSSGPTTVFEVDDTGTVTAEAFVGDGSGLTGIAGGYPAATYIIQTAEAGLTNAQVLGSLATGLLKNTTTTGVLSIAVANTDYVIPNSPTLITPTLGVATATSINKVAITAPATGSTLTIADGKTATISNTVTIQATDGATINVGTGGTLGTAAYTATSAYAAAKHVGFQTLTDAATITYDCNSGVNAQVTLGDNRTLSAPSNASAGMSGTLLIIQDGTGGRTLNFALAYKFHGTDPLLSVDPDKIDIMTWFTPNGTDFYAVITNDFS